MPELQFQIEGAEAVAHAAAPLLALKLRIRNLPETETIHTLMLRCQVQIEPAKRRYLPPEQEKLTDLFGEPERWSRTVRPLLWMNTTVAVPGFTDSVVVDLQLPCSFDFNVAATKYFHALDAGEIPLCVMFSGTVFYQSEAGSAAGRAGAVGSRGELPPAGGGVEADDGDALSELCVALSRTGCVRAPACLQDAAGHSDVGAGDQAGADDGGDRRGGGMNFAGAEEIAAAILYEGYILYPYRPTAVKNRQRWNFGTLYPRVYAEAQRPAEPFRLVAECLAVADANAQC